MSQTKLIETVRDCNREITPADRHGLLKLIEQQAARIAELEARERTMSRLLCRNGEGLCVMDSGLELRLAAPVASGPRYDWTVSGMKQSETGNWVMAGEAADGAMAKDAWQPIETAPIDGTEVLLIATRHSMLMPYPERIVGAYRRGWWSGPSTLSHVTHWMPLPDAPIAGSAEKAGD